MCFYQISVIPQINVLKRKIFFIFLFFSDAPPVDFEKKWKVLFLSYVSYPILKNNNFLFFFSFIYYCPKLIFLFYLILYCFYHTLIIAPNKFWYKFNFVVFPYVRYSLASLFWQNGILCFPFMSVSNIQ